MPENPTIDVPYTPPVEVYADYPDNPDAFDISDGARYPTQEEYDANQPAGDTGP